MKVDKVASYDVREKWTAIVDKIRREKGAVVVEKYSKPAVAVIDFQLLLQIEEKLGIKLEYATTEADFN